MYRELFDNNQIKLYYGDNILWLWTHLIKVYI